MELSKITGKFISDERELSRECEDEKFYFYTFQVEDGLDINVQVSEYITIPIGVPVAVTGCLSSCKRYSATKGRKAMFTYFDARLIEPMGEDEAPSKRIVCSGVVAHIYNLSLTQSGIEKLTIVVKESQGKNRVSIIHYTALGKRARQIYGTIHERDRVVGYGVLQKKTESFEVLLSDLEKVE